MAGRRKQGMSKFRLIVDALGKPESLKTKAKSNYANFSINMHMITMPNKRDGGGNDSSTSEGRRRRKRKKVRGRKDPKIDFSFTHIGNR